MAPLTSSPLIRIGITGGIGSGKSTIAKIFEVLGIPVYYADTAARQIMNTDEALKRALIENFGEAAYKDGVIDRTFLSSIVFNDAGKLALLNSLTHPTTIRDADQWIAKQTTPYVLKEAALLFESGANKHLDHIIGVYAPAELRIRRVMKRDGITKEEVIKRMAKQMDEEEKMKKCDSIITNDEQQLVIPQVMALHKKFLMMHKELQTQ